MILRVLFFGSIFLIAMASQLDATAPPPGCDEESSHQADPETGQPGSPHDQHVDDPDEDNQCHGKDGDSGSCTVGSGGDSASVVCIYNFFTRQSHGCVATANCGPGVNLSCGGAGWDAFAGIDKTSNKAYYFCEKDGTAVDGECP